MTTIKDIMTRDVAVVQSTDTLTEAARTMDRLNVGSLPVCDGDRVVGMVTDRDITVRAVAAGLAPDRTPVSEVMTHEVLFCRETDSVAHAMDVMGDAQIRRLTVLDDERRIAGIVALGDLATRQPQHTDMTLREISEPTPSPTSA